MDKCAVLLPAAGASSRMRGRDKLLEDVHGAPCLRVMAERALASGADVIVTLPSLSHARADALDGLDVTLIAVPDPAEGMAASLRAGAKAAKDMAALMILPPDMPSILASDIRVMWRAFNALPCPAILRATTERGEPGHPVVFDAAFLPAFAHLTGDTGAAAILQANMAALGELALQGARARADLDQPEDWEAWRAALTAPE